MPLKLRGIELDRRIKTVIDQTNITIEAYKERSVEIEKQMGERIRMVPSPLDIFRSHISLLERQIEALQWLSGAIILNEVHEVGVDELMGIGLIVNTGSHEECLSKMIEM